MPMTEKSGLCQKCVKNIVAYHKATLNHQKSVVALKFQKTEGNTHVRQALGATGVTPTSKRFKRRVEPEKVEVLADAFPFSVQDRQGFRLKSKLKCKILLTTAVGKLLDPRRRKVLQA